MLDMFTQPLLMMLSPVAHITLVALVLQRRLSEWSARSLHRIQQSWRSHSLGNDTHSSTMRQADAETQ